MLLIIRSLDHIAVVNDIAPIPEPEDEIVDKEPEEDMDVEPENKPPVAAKKKVQKDAATTVAAKAGKKPTRRATKSSTSSTAAASASASSLPPPPPSPPCAITGCRLLSTKACIDCKTLLCQQHVEEHGGAEETRCHEIAKLDDLDAAPIIPNSTHIGLVSSTFSSAQMAGATSSTPSDFPVDALPKANKGKRKFDLAEVSEDFDSLDESHTYNHIYLLDNCSAHRRPEVARAFKRRGIIPFYLPPNSTSALQPLDLSLNKVIKSKIKTMQLEWQLTEFMKEGDLHGTYFGFCSLVLIFFFLCSSENTHTRPSGPLGFTSGDGARPCNNQEVLPQARMDEGTSRRLLGEPPGTRR